MLGEGGLGSGAIKLASAYVDVRAPTAQLGRDYATAKAQTQSFARSSTAAMVGVERSTARAAKTVGASWLAAGARSEAAARKLKAPALATALVGAAAGKMAVDFDREMRNVNSIAQLPERQLKRLEGQVLNLAGPTAQAPKTLAAGLYDLVSSGFNAQQSMKVLRSSAKAATAGLTTTEVSTKAVAAVLNAYRLPAQRARAVSDTLFRTVDRGVITFESLAQNVGDVLPFASSLGVNLREVGASIATMTKSGITAPETMTRIKAAMVTMLKPGEDLKGVIKELGFADGEAMVKKLGFLGTMQRLNKVAGGSKSELAELFPNIRALGGVLAITGDNAKAAAGDLRGMKEDSGATSRALSQQSQSIAYQWQKLRSEAEALAVKVGGKMLPVLSDLMKLGFGLVATFGELPEPMQKLIIAAGLLSAAMYPVLLIGGKLMTLWGGFLGLITKVEMSLTGQAAAATGAAAANAQLAASTTAAANAQRQLLIANSSGKVTGAVNVPPAGGPVAGGGRWAKWANRLGTGALLGTAGMGIGGAMGGDLGNFVSGASAGAGIGMIGGPLGAGIGAMVGGTAANVKTLIDDLNGAGEAQRKFAGSAESVAKAMRRQRAAVAGVRAATANTQAAQNRAQRSSERVKEAEQNLTRVRRRFGPTSRQALHAEYELARARRQNARDSNELENAERKQGTSLRQYKAVTRQTVADQRTRIAHLKRETERIGENFRKQEHLGASGKKLAAIGEHGLRVEARLAKVRKEHTRTMREAAQIAGRGWANQIKRADTATLRFWTQIKRGEPLLNRLGNNPSPKKLQRAFEDMNRRTATLMRNLRTNLGDTGTSYSNMGDTGSEALRRLGDNTNRFAQAFGGPAANFSIGSSGGGGGGGGGGKKAKGEYRTGGKVTKPIAIMGEEAPRHPEWVVPTNPAYRNQALGYWTQAGRDLGVPGFAEGGRHGGAGSLPKPIISGPEPKAAIAQAPVDKAYTIATAYLRKKEAEARSAAAGGLGTFVGPPPSFRELGNNAWVDSHTRRVAAFLASKFGREISSDYRSPAHNAAVGGVPGSSHTRGSPANPGAFDFVPPSTALQKWAGQHIAGLTENMIHDAGSGLHNHIAFFAMGGLLKRFAKGGRHGGAGAASASSALPAWVHGSSTLSPDQMATLAHYVGAKHPGLMSQIAGAESGGNPRAMGGAGDKGLWQIIPSTASAFGIDYGGLFDPLNNAKGMKKVLDGQGLSAWTTYNTGAYASEPKGTPSGSLAGAGGAAKEETVPAVFHGARTKKISFPAMPKSLRGVKREIVQRQNELKRYRAARRKAEGKPKIERAIAANVTALETRLTQLFRERAKLRREAAKKRISKRLGRELGSLTGYEDKIAARQRAYEAQTQTAEQIVALEPQPPELPASATDAQREAAERAYVATLQGYVDTRERPAYQRALGLAGSWRNTILRGQQKTVGMEQGWEKRIRATEREIDQINAYSKKVAADVAKWRKEHPKAKNLPKHLREAEERKHKEQARLPVLRYRERALRNTLGQGRGIFYPGMKDPVKPPPTPLPGTGTFEEALQQVQGIHWPDQHSIIKALPAERVAGRFGGAIWDTQTVIAELDLKVAGAAAGLGGGSSGDGTDTNERTDLIEAAREIVTRDTQRRMIEEAQKRVLDSLPPFGGSFALGGEVPGPRGAARTVIAHGGETINPVGGSDSPIVVQIIVEDGAVDAGKIRAIADQAVDVRVRRGGRAAGRRMPGGPGGTFTG